MEQNSERVFIVIGHSAKPTPDFSLNDLSGSGGRIDILTRCINSSFMLSHGFRKDTITYLLIRGGDKDVILEFVGSELKYMNPDERNIASLIKIALKDIWPIRAKPATPGIYAYYGGMETILERYKNKKIYYLHEKGEKFKSLESGVYVMGDRDDLTFEEEEILIKRMPTKLSLGDISYHADHCITIVNYLIDINMAD